MPLWIFCVMLVVLFIGVGDVPVLPGVVLERIVRGVMGDCWIVDGFGDSCIGYDDKGRYRILF